MAVVKFEPNYRKDLLELSSSEDLNTSNVTVTRNVSNLSPFSQFYCKRVTVQNSNGNAPSITRIEEAVFGCNPAGVSAYNQYNYSNGQSTEPFLNSDKFERHGHSQKRRSHSSKHKSDRKCSKKEGKLRRSHRKLYKDIYRKIAVAVILGSPFLVWWFSTLLWCQAKPLEFLELETSLKHEVIGQEEAISSILLNFYRTSNLNNQPPVFLLSGSTGVGKSFIIDLIVSHFPGSGHKELLFYPTAAPESVVKNLKACEHNLLVIDSLYFQDTQEVAHWVERLLKEAAILQKQVWFLLVFTTEHWTSDTTFTPSAEFIREISKISRKIDDIFKEREISTQLITFKPMEVENVKECARKELENFSLLADETQLNQIVRELTSTPTLRLKGCKHVNKYFMHSDNIIGLSKAD